MFENINIHSSVAVYVQIENHVLFAVSSGRLKASDKLPSIGELAKRLNVNLNTVAKAYRDLEVMGIVYTRRGMGVFINDGVAAKCAEDCRRRIVSRLHEVVAEGAAAGMKPQEIKQACTKSFSVGGDPLWRNPRFLVGAG